MKPTKPTKAPDKSTEKAERSTDGTSPPADIKLEPAQPATPVWNGPQMPLKGTWGPPPTKSTQPKSPKTEPDPAADENGESTELSLELDKIKELSEKEEHVQAPSLEELERQAMFDEKMTLHEQGSDVSELFHGKHIKTMGDVLFREIGLPKLSSSKESALAKAKKYAEFETGRIAKLRRDAALQPRNAYALYHQSRIPRNVTTPMDAISKIKQATSSQQIQFTQALSLMARVYVGSINYDVREEDVRKAFLVFGPLKSLNMSYDPATGKHMGFAFLEFDLPEAAELALAQMDGYMMSTRPIKVGRPSNMPQASDIIEKIAAEAKKFHRIYVSCVHPDLTQDDLRSVFEAFGKVTACGLAQTTSFLQHAAAKHKGYGYIEFDNEQSATEAIMSMNLFDRFRGYGYIEFDNEQSATEAIMSMNLFDRFRGYGYIEFDNEQSATEAIMSMNLFDRFRGYGYIEFDNEQSATEAIMSMNLFDRFRGYGYIEFDNEQSATEAIMSMNLFDRFRGYGYIEFDNEQSATEAIMSMNLFDRFRGYGYIEFDNEQSATEAIMSMNLFDRFRGYGYIEFDNEQSATEAIMSMNLFDRFRGYGYIEFDNEQSATEAIMSMNLFDRFRGYGYIEFDNEQSATEAIMSMNLFDRFRGYGYIEFDNEQSATEAIMSMNLFDRFRGYGYIEFDNEQSATEAIMSMNLFDRFRGYGYIEFDNEQSATEAIMSMNLFDLGGQLLRVGRAITPPDNTTDPRLNASGRSSPDTSRAQSPVSGGRSRFSTAPKMVVPPPTVLAPEVAGPGASFTIPQPGVVTPQLYSSPKPGSPALPPPTVVEPTALASQPPVATPSSTADTGEASTSDQNGPTSKSVEGSGPVKVEEIDESTINPIAKIAAQMHRGAGGAAAGKKKPKKRKAPGGSSGHSAITGGSADDSKALVKLGGGKRKDSWAVATLDHGKGKGAAKKKKGKKGGNQGQQKAPEEKKPEGSVLDHQLRSNDAVKQKLLSNVTLSEKQRQLIEAESSQSIAAQEDIKIKGNEARSILMQKLMRRLESPVVVLRNMVGSEDVDEYLEEEVMEECSKFGQVKKVIIYEEQQGTADDAPVIVKIFVHFSLSSEAEAAKSKLDGRYFGGRTLKAEIYDQRLFEANDLTG